MENNDLRITQDTTVSELMHALDDETSGLLEDDLSVNQEELTHWGLKGMRWGIRRFQRKDGSLTKAGQRRKEKLEKELKQLKGPKKRDASGKFVSDKPKEEVKKKPKTLVEMDDDELRKYVTRKALERDAINVTSQLDALNPPKVSAGKKFMSSVFNDVIAPAAKNAAKDALMKYATKTLTKQLGLDEKANPLEAAAKNADMEQRIWNARTAKEKFKFQENLTRDAIDKSNRERAAREKAGRVWVENTTLMSSDWDW